MATVVVVDASAEVVVVDSVVVVVESTAEDEGLDVAEVEIDVPSEEHATAKGASARTIRSLRMQ
ncbi:MAG: hypothetical protein ABI862_19835 [Ilumatobacteraceae bacterium]